MNTSTGGGRTSRRPDRSMTCPWPRRTTSRRSRTCPAPRSARSASARAATRPCNCALCCNVRDVRVLVIGSGGREHAIVRALDRDPAVTALHAAPGNPGIAELAQVHQVKAANPPDVTRLAKALDAGLVVIGPEAPLVAGVADALRADGRAAFGPDAAAARIEGSKAFAKEIMAEAGIPTASSL